MMSDLKLLDAVTVKAPEGMPARDGVVAYLDPNNEIEIGVQLTGDSVGLGDHSGSVDGIEYFGCPLNSGLFVNRDALEIRKLNRIQELRLKRELAAAQLAMSRSPRTRSRQNNSTQDKPPE
jgi:dynactin complex subunit